MDKRKKMRNLILIWNDAICLILSYIGGYYLGALYRGRNIRVHQITDSLWAVLLCYILVFLFFNMNDYFMKRNKYEEFTYVLKVNIIVSLALVVAFYVSKQTLILLRGVWLFTIILNIASMTATHLLIKRILRKVYRMSKNEHMLLITRYEFLERITSELMRTGVYDNYLISVVVLDRDMTDEGINGYRIVADANNYLTVAKREIVDEAFVVLDWSEQTLIRQIVEQFNEMGIVTNVNLGMLDEFEGSMKQFRSLGNHSVISFAPRFFDYNKLVAKRIIDIAGGCVGLIITGIIMLFVVPAIKLESPGPVIFKQKRVGKNGRFFYIYKLRSMYKDAEAHKAELMEKNEMDGLMFKMTDDPRITKVGKFIRATSIDELPQFWNVLKGDMSLVGTRPPTVDEFRKYEGRHKRRLSMKPGLTGLWQVSGRSDITDFEEVVRLDCQYIDNWNLQLDLQILLKTVGVVFKKVGSK